MLDAKQIRVFQKEILDWYSKNKRDLPWRQTRDPYAILVSEVMLQQTQVSRVVPKFTAWMKEFPTVQVLAKATTKSVLSFWSGLGYNRRALYLQKLANEVVKNNNGIFSHDEKELQKLPGIGEYTSKAIVCFAFDKQVAVIDTNVKKVIAVHFFKGKVPDKKVLTEIADQLLPKGRAYEWNQALMDYASQELKLEKIPIPKQSPFKQSKRFYRGQIIRLLLHKSETLHSLFTTIENNGITKGMLQAILQDMQKDGLVLQEKNYYSLPQ